MLFDWLSRLCITFMHYVIKFQNGGFSSGKKWHHVAYFIVKKSVVSSRWISEVKHLYCFRNLNESDWERLRVRLYPCVCALNALHFTSDQQMAVISYKIMSIYMKGQKIVTYRQTNHPFRWSLRCWIEWWKLEVHKFSRSRD